MTPLLPRLLLLAAAALTLLGAWLSARAARCGARAAALAAARWPQGAQGGALTLTRWAAREGYTFELRRCPVIWGEPSLWLTHPRRPPIEVSASAPASAPPPPAAPSAT